MIEYPKRPPTNLNLEPVSAEFEPSLRRIHTAIENREAETPTRISLFLARSSAASLPPTCPLYPNSGARACGREPAVRHLAHLQGDLAFPGGIHTAQRFPAPFPCRPAGHQSRCAAGSPGILLSIE